MDDLPELPFEKVLSYLSLEDRLKSRAISRRWCERIDSFRVKRLCFSQCPSGFVWAKDRWISGAFAQNFISSTRFESFVTTFGPTILFNLKHLRLCCFDLNTENVAEFAQTLQSFGQLEELVLLHFGYWHSRADPGVDLQLNLPLLKSILLENVHGIRKLTLDTPRLVKVKLSCSSTKLDLLHGESVEKLATDRLKNVAVKQLKNLKYLHNQQGQPAKFDSTFLSDLKQLKEIHLHHEDDTSKMFEQMQRFGRVDLKVFQWGLLLNGPDDPAMHSLFNWLDRQGWRCLAENQSRLADEILLYDDICYGVIEEVSPELENVLSRFTDLDRTFVFHRVQDTARFLKFLNRFKNIIALEIWSDQPQELFDRLPEHCAVQWLTIKAEISDFAFLFKLKHLFYLTIEWSIDTHSIRKFLNELPFLAIFSFQFLGTNVKFDLVRFKQFKVSVAGRETTVSDLNAAIKFIMENAGKKPIPRIEEDFASDDSDPDDLDNVAF